MFQPSAQRFLIVIAVIFVGCKSGPVRSTPNSAPEARAIEFLKREVPAWSRENDCFSCHNNGDAARALYAATRHGYSIPEAVLADTTSWLRQPGNWEDNTGDPGYSDQRLANLQFAGALVAAHEAGHVTDRGPLEEAARKVAADQDANGVWPIEPGNAVGSPATYGTTLATFLALHTLERIGDPGTTEAMRRAEQWLAQVAPDNIPAAATLLLARALDSPRSNDFKIKESLGLLRRAQAGDGGWGPYADAPPEAFDTAIVLLALVQVGDAVGVGDLIRRGRAFLAAQQQADGSWRATTRPSGGDSYAQQVSTTAWGTLALLATKNVD
ncbi:MAG: hypothetical protein ACR2OZ_12105 [Verrucomicrobiales bacterium]